MKAAITYIFQNKRYKEIISSYNTVISKYKVALEIWLEHESLSLTENFEFKTLIAENFSIIQTIDSWIKTYNKTQANCKSGLLWFFIEKGQSTIPNPRYKEYQLVSENFSYINTLQGYINVYNRLLRSDREAIDRFLNSSRRNHSYGEIKKIAINERRILIIADVLKKAHTCENKFNRAWKLFANGRSFNNIPLQELCNINEDSFDTKNSFLFYYNKTPKLISLILGKDMLPIGSFSEETIAQERETYPILCSKDGELPKIDYIEPFHADVHLEPGKELKRAILDSISYGEKCNFVDTYTISEFYTLRRDFDAIGVYFDDAVRKVKDNISAVKSYNKDSGNEAAVFIEDYLRVSTKGTALYDYIETYTQEKDKRDNAKRIKKSYPKGVSAIFGDLDLDTCSLSYVIKVIEAESRVRIKHNEIEDAEQKRIEAEKKRQEEERKRQERFRKQQEAEQSKRLFLSKVSDWDLLKGSLRYFSLLRYFPVSCNIDATESEWEDRWTVWNFKNTPGKTSAEDHEKALGTVISALKYKLISTFGKDLLKKITLVCIPASSAIKTQRRYEDFSEIICEKTGMTNAYEYIEVLSSSEEKKFGGSGISTSNLSFDESFFKDKYVILFDDVITKGDSMLRFKSKMEQLGATVICGMSIGKTTHSR